MKPERRAQLEDQMREMGVPDHVVAYAMTHRLNWWIWLAASAAFLPIMGAGFAVGWAYIWPALEAMTERNAIAHAQACGALLYHFNFGLSLILGLFAWIMLAGALAGYVPALSRTVRANVFVYSVIGAQRAALVGGGVKAIQRIGDEPDPKLYIDKMLFGWIPPMALAGVSLALICLVAADREVRMHSVFTEDAYERAAFLPWETKARPWSEAVSVELGCNHVERRDSVTDTIIYEIEFADGHKERIGDATPLHGSWVDAAEVIDQRLQAAGARFERWTWLDRDPLHPECLAALQRRFSPEEYQRVRALLRVEAL